MTGCCVNACKVEQYVLTIIKKIIIIIIIIINSNHHVSLCNIHIQ